MTVLVKVKNEEIIIREVSEQEKPFIGQLLLESYQQYEQAFVRERWKKYEQELKGAAENKCIDKFFVAQYKGKLIGTIQLFRSSYEAYGLSHLDIHQPIIRFLAVHPNGRGLGIAKKLLETAINHSKSDGKKAIYLHTTDIMEQAIQLYKHYGFVRHPEKDFLKNKNPISCYKLDIQ